MARTPSLTVAEAEALLGPAADLIVTSDNRATLRKWCTARGMRSVDANALSNVELANLYHEHGPLTTPATAFPVRSDIPVPAPASAPSAPAKADEAALALANLIRSLAGGSAILDADAVRSTVAPMIGDSEKRMADFVADALANHTSYTRIEVKTPTAVNVIPGAVHNITPTVIQVVGLGHDVMLVGPAGSGKTTIGQNVAVALGLPFYVTSTVFDTHELMGFVDGMGKYHTTAFRHAYQNGGVWVADEIDAWDAAALLAANSALANGIATFPDSEMPIARHPNFRIIATANTFGHGADRVYVGRNELDAASLDRFAVFDMDYDADLERMFAGTNQGWYARVIEIRTAIRAKNIRHVVSSRAIIKGVQALAAGIPLATVENLYVFKGMSSGDRAKIGE